ncbi:MAG: AMP-binding protein [Solirubrobacterales bacterium]|jgi:fatty-acyl-CoA synthase|nr:AMP-binding protein [Solirubrobacterales bacterium]
MRWTEHRRVSPNSLTVGTLVQLGAARSPTRAAVMTPRGDVRTYAQLDARTDRLANALLANGLVPGDRVAAWMEDCVEYIELYLAVAKAGLVMVPINARLRSAEAAFPLRDSGARALVWTSGLNEGVGELEELDDLLRVSLDADAERDSHSFEDLVSRGREGAPPAPEPDSIYIIGYTSGTTGRPKGAILTHASVLALARLNALSYRLPLFSVAALTGSMSFVATVPAHIISHLYVGGTLIVMGRWDVESLLATVQAQRATFTYIPSPTLAEFTEAAAADTTPWSSLESILHSGSRASPDKLRGLCEVIGGRFVEGLGMTENSGGLITATTREDIEGVSEAHEIFASVGRAVAESAVDVLDPDGVPVERDGSSIGELAISSPALMTGYWNLPEATAQALKDGWYMTGDLASIDPAGYVYIAERRTDLIISGGMNVYPTEVEEHLATMPGVLECAVVGLPHERWGQTVVAAVVRDSSAAISEPEVIEHCRQGLASYKKPTTVVFVDELPRTTSLKVKRSAIRDLLGSQLAERGS